MSPTSTTTLHEVVPRLKGWLRDSGLTMRNVAELTSGLKTPERIAHSNLSSMLNCKPGNNLYFQQTLVLMNLLKLHPAALFLGTDDAFAARNAVDLALAFLKLPRARQSHLLESVVAEAKEHK